MQEGWHSIISLGPHECQRERLCTYSGGWDAAQDVIEMVEEIGMVTGLLVGIENGVNIHGSENGQGREKEA